MLFTLVTPLASPTMDSLVVRNAIASIFSKKELTINATRTEQVKRYVTELLNVIDREEFQPNFEAFSMNLLASLKSVFQCSKPTTVPNIKDRIWIQYAEIRANKLPIVWNAFLTSISRTHLGSKKLLTELINEQIMKDLMIDIFKVQQHGDKVAAFTECIARMQGGREDNKPLSSFRPSLGELCYVI